MLFGHVAYRHEYRSCFGVSKDHDFLWVIVCNTGERLLRGRVRRPGGVSPTLYIILTFYNQRTQLCYALEYKHRHIWQFDWISVVSLQVYPIKHPSRWVPGPALPAGQLLNTQTDFYCHTKCDRLTKSIHQLAEPQINGPWQGGCWQVVWCPGLCPSLQAAAGRLGEAHAGVWARGTAHQLERSRWPDSQPGRPGRRRPKLHSRGWAASGQPALQAAPGDPRGARLGWLLPQKHFRGSNFRLHTLRSQGLLHNMTATTSTDSDAVCNSDSTLYSNTVV